MSPLKMRLFSPLVCVMLLLVVPAGTTFAWSAEAPALVLPSLPESARSFAVLEDDKPQLQVRLVISKDPALSKDPTSKDPTPRVGILFDLAPGWHLYWRNPGETGIAPELGLRVDGYRTLDVAWPTPEVFREADGLFTTYGYEGRVLLVTSVEANATRSSEVDDDFDASRSLASLVHADTTVLVCRTQCVPASVVLSSPLDQGLSDQDQARVDALFRETDARVPVAASALGFEANARWTRTTPNTNETEKLEVGIRTCANSNGERCPTVDATSKHALFIPMEGETFEFSEAQLVADDASAGHFTISLDALRLEEGEDRLRGLVQIAGAEENGRARFVELDLPILQSDSKRVVAPLVAPLIVTPPVPPLVTPGRWIQIVFLALLGGLILNGMPCVLPVLAIKVVAIADMAEKNPRDVQLHGLAYTGGVLGSMALLSAIVIGLRAAGHSVGWGFQFQEPLFVAGISALLVAFALNLFGVFEIEFGQGRLASVGQDSSGIKRSAFEGLLAVILATPCTAPFLGTAVGFAFATSGFGIAAIFLAIGFGLASPFLVVSFFPRLARFIPRSGPWMLKLRAGLGFSLLATVVWLLWVLGQSGGTGAVVGMTGNLLFLAFLLWGFGQLQPLRKVWLGRAGAIAITGLAFAGFNLIDFDRADRTVQGNAANSETEDAAGWRSYSERAVAETLANGHPAFVVFTADWCITCKMNEHTVLNRPTIREAFRKNGHVLFKADWTRRDETIRLKLAEFGRAGVPLYLVYSPEAPDQPKVLSELLSQKEVLAALTGSRFASRD